MFQRCVETALEMCAKLESNVYEFTAPVNIDVIQA